MTLTEMCGDGEMGLSMCGRFGDWVILGLGYPVDWVYPGTGFIQLGDGITSLIGKIGSSGGGEEVGDGDNLGYTCNLLEHE